jgi:DNA repair exonuclease SbcCD ATPase subunit
VFARTDERARALEETIAKAASRAGEVAEQTKLFDQANALKGELERRIEDLRADLDRLEQRRAEAGEIEAQFTKVKRLEDDINAKMSKFLSEQHRIEVMEADFKRLLQTSQSVEEKLRDVTAADDNLQEMQVKIRKFAELVTAAEEKYKRVEGKNEALEETAAGIDTNFKAMQTMERAAAELARESERLKEELSLAHASIAELAADNKKARDTVEKLSTLDESLAEIETRIEAMNGARQWLANLETRMDEKTKELKDQVKLIGNISKNLKPEAGGGANEADSKGAPSQNVRENVIKLKRQGWETAEIARTLKISVGAVELIVETTPR